MIQIQPETPLRDSIEEKAREYERANRITMDIQDGVDAVNGYIAGYKQALADLENYGVDNKEECVNTDIEIHKDPLYGV